MRENGLLRLGIPSRMAVFSWALTTLLKRPPRPMRGCAALLGDSSFSARFAFVLNGSCIFLFRRQWTNIKCLKLDCLVLQLYIGSTIILIYSSRLQLNQMLILPPYQCKGYGRCLLEVITDVAVSENVYDLTVEEPLDSLQRTYSQYHRHTSP
ncbi:hypothetical protein Dimus_011439 [Dionaea muscipula]